jgi:hypothetical protein
MQARSWSQARMAAHRVTANEERRGRQLSDQPQRIHPLVEERAPVGTATPAVSGSKHRGPSNPPPTHDRLNQNHPEFDRFFPKYKNNRINNIKCQRSSNYVCGPMALTAARSSSGQRTSHCPMHGLGRVEQQLASKSPKARRAAPKQCALRPAAPLWG